MNSFTHFLYIVAIALAPAGTHEITVSAGNESYHWSIDGRDVEYSSTQLQSECKTSSDPEHPLLTNDILPENYASDESATSLISKHDWVTHHVLSFDPYHQLEKDPDGYVYAVRIGSNSQKLYSFTFEQ